MAVLLTVLFAVAGPILVLWLLSLLLRGEDLSAYDTPLPVAENAGQPASAETAAVIQRLQQLTQGAEASGSGAMSKERLLAMRKMMDDMGDAHPISSQVTATDAGGVPAEWILAANADANRRLLYIHGGAFTMGSPRSHRALTSALSERCGVAVLAIDYRLMPEHQRMAGIDDCRNAWRWLLDNGPEGAAPAKTLFVAGDSAGGNLTLSLIAWQRDAGVRMADAAVALSPATDSTMASPSLFGNIPTDPMLGPMFGKMAKIPKWIMRLGTWLQNRIRPNDPVISPAFGSLDGLPPVLVQVSTAEMLFDDGNRWGNKAKAQGTDARVQAWDHMLHVWQIFTADGLPEANQALDNIQAFIKEHNTVAASADNEQAAAG